MARVMVVEDEPGIQLILRLALSDEGHQVEGVTDGAAALQRLESGPRPDIILTDLQLPGLKGTSLVEAVHTDPATRDIPIIIITGSITSAYNLPPRDTYSCVIQKPFDLNDLTRMVTQLTQDPLTVTS